MNAVNVGLVTFIIQYNRIQGVFLLCKITNLLIYRYNVVILCCPSINENFATPSGTDFAGIVTNDPIKCCLGFSESYSSFISVHKIIYSFFPQLYDL